MIIAPSKRPPPTVYAGSRWTTYFTKVNALFTFLVLQCSRDNTYENKPTTVTNKDRHKYNILLTVGEHPAMGMASIQAGSRNTPRGGPFDYWWGTVQVPKNIDRCLKKYRAKLLGRKKYRAAKIMFSGSRPP